MASEKKHDEKIIVTHGLIGIKTTSLPRQLLKIEKEPWTQAEPFPQNLRNRSSCGFFFILLTHSCICLGSVVTVVISAISNSFEILNMLTTIHSFSSKHEWLINNSIYEFPIDTIPSSYVWIMLATLEWPSQVTDLSAMNIPAKSNSHLFLWTINSVTSESYLITSLVYSFYSDICINTIV